MNEHQRRAQEYARAQQQFLQALSAGQIHALDRFGMALKPGQKILLDQASHVLYDIVAINPVLDPNMPPGVVDVLMECRLTIRMPANQKYHDILVQPHLKGASSDADVNVSGSGPSNEAQKPEADPPPEAPEVRPTLGLVPDIHHPDPDDPPL